MKDTDETFVNILSRVGKCIRVNILYLKVLESGFHIVKKFRSKINKEIIALGEKVYIYLKMR